MNSFRKQGRNSRLTQARFSIAPLLVSDTAKVLGRF
jgi:hypothetical protein